MRTSLECVPCIVNQAVSAPRRFTDDQSVLERVVKETMEALAEFDFSRSPPEMGGLLNRIMNRALGMDDPYLTEKRRFNSLAHGMLPRLREMVRSSKSPFETAVRLAIAGNIIDFGAPAGKTDDSVIGFFEQAVATELGSEDLERVRDLEGKAKQASEILYIADNAGEIVLDRLVLELLPEDRVTVAVRGGPAINDALLEDAHQAGLKEVASIITTGVSLPGAPLDRCSREFVERFRDADVIISKGQGNFETLSEERGDIFFLLVCKCETVATHLKRKIGDFVIV